MIEKIKVVYGTDPDDFIEYNYNDESANPLTEERMFKLDVDLEEMSLTDEEFNAWLNERDEVEPELLFDL